MSAVAAAPGIVLSPDQETALARAELLEPGGFLFVTGKAGTGKSTVLRELKKRMAPVVLAPTGIAAVNVGGQTIHSFFGFKPGQTSASLPQRARNILPRIGVLPFDEIGMVRADLLDACDASLRRGMGSDLPFGGIPIVAFGDPYQIEPVCKGGAERQLIEERYGSPFFFDSASFRAARAQAVSLTHVFRQSGDARFRDALNDLRVGGTASLAVFNERAGAEPAPDTIRLTFTNARARAINEARLQEIEGEAKRFLGTIDGCFGYEYPTDIELDLKIGARVMVLQNDAWADHFNGDLGYVADFDERNGSVLVDLDRGHRVWLGRYTWEKLGYAYNEESKEIEAKVEASFCQFPLKLAWAVSVHKSQGQTFDACHIEKEGRAFAHGQMYVALSRCRTLAGLSLGERISPVDVICKRRVREWCAEVGI